MIDVRLVPFRMIVGRKFQSGEAGIAKAAQVERGHGIAAQPEKAEWPALKTVDHFVAAAADFDEVLPVTHALANVGFFLGRFAGPRISRGFVERPQLLLAGLGDWHGRNET